MSVHNPPKFSSIVSVFATALRTELCPHDAVLAAHLISAITDALVIEDHGADGVNEEVIDAHVERFVDSLVGTVAYQALLETTRTLLAEKKREASDVPRDPSQQN